MESVLEVTRLESEVVCLFPVAATFSGYALFRKGIFQLPFAGVYRWCTYPVTRVGQLSVVQVPKSSSQRVGQPHEHLGVHFAD